MTKADMVAFTRREGVYACTNPGEQYESNPSCQHEDVINSGDLT